MSVHKIGFIIGGFPATYDVDFQTTTQDGNLLATQIEAMFVNGLCDNYIQALDDSYVYRRRHMTQLWGSGLGKWWEMKKQEAANV